MMPENVTLIKEARNNSSSESPATTSQVKAAGSVPPARVTIGQDERQPLTSHDINKLKKESWLTEQIIKDAAIYRVDSAGGALVMNEKRRKERDLAGIVFPSYFPGDPRTSGYLQYERLRRDKPDYKLDSEGNQKPENKYLCGRGTKNHFYFSPYAAPDELQDVSIPVYIVEGEKKTLALDRYFRERGQAALVLGLSGVWNFRESKFIDDPAGGSAQVKQSTLIPDFNRIAWDGRQAFILFDSNVHSNSSVGAARTCLKREMSDMFGAHVRTIDLPTDEDGKLNGIDDYLAAKGPEFVDQLLRRHAESSGIEIEIGAFVYRCDSHGVFRCGKSTSKIEGVEWDIVSSPIRHLGGCRSERGNDWGHLLEITDRKGLVRKFLMPLSMRNDERIRAIKNYDITVFNEQALQLYLDYKSSKVLETYRRQGYTRDCSAFIFHDEVIGSAQSVYFDSHGETLTSVQGSLDDWKREVSAFCVGNPYLIFGISVALAPPLFRLLKKEGGVFHFHSDTSSGKSTLLRASGSVWGGGGEDGYLRVWNATANALEVICAEHNDGLLCVDEISQCDARDFEKVSYTLINGQGKGRLSRDSKLMDTLGWKTLILSTGNVTTEDKLRQAGVRMNGGHRVRNLDIPVVGKYGVFDDLHGETTDKTGRKKFADRLSNAARAYFGAPIRRLIAELTREKAEDCGALASGFLRAWGYSNAHEEAVRIVEKFALCAAAGVMATEFGITGWDEGEAIDAARLMAELTVGKPDKAKTGSDEEDAVSVVRLFIERHGASRFQPLVVRRVHPGGEPAEPEPQELSIRDQAGYRDSEYFHFTPEVFRTDVCQGMNHERVCAALQSRGLLKTAAGMAFQNKTGPKKDRKNVYSVSRRILTGEDVAGVQ